MTCFPPSAKATHICLLGATALLFFLISNALASPESPTPTPKPTAAAKSPPTTNTARPRRTARGEPIYASHPVGTRSVRSAKSNDMRYEWIQYGGRWYYTPVDYGTYRRREQIGLEQERRGEGNITSEQRRLWQRMDRPWGTPWRSFSAPDEHGYPNN